MNQTQLNNTPCKNPPCTIKQGKLPLWFIVLFIVSLVWFLSTLAANYSKLRVSKNANKAQMAMLIDQKKELLQQPDVINTNWLRTLNSKMKDVQGGIVWSTFKQQGVVYFKNLPTSIQNQQYRLWVYDLTMDANKRVSAANFQLKRNGSPKLLVPLTPNESLELPYKFELVLEELGEKQQVLKEHPLLLAQP